MFSFLFFLLAIGIVVYIIYYSAAAQEAKKRKKSHVAQKDVFKLMRRDFGNSSSDKFWNRYKKIIVPLLIVLVVGMGAYAVAYRTSERTVAFTVRQLPQRVFQGNPYSNLVYTDKGVYENTDSLFFVKYRSSDVFNQLQTGHSYTCRVAGWRVGFLSYYKDIINCNGFMD